MSWTQGNGNMVFRSPYEDCVLDPCPWGIGLDYLMLMIKGSVNISRRMKSHIYTLSWRKFMGLRGKPEQAIMHLMENIKLNASH